MKTMKRILAFVIVIAMVSAICSDTVTAKTKVKLNKKKITLSITNKKKNPTATLKVKGLSKKMVKKAKWYTSKKSVATVKKGKVTAKNAGKTTITCKVKGKKYTCKVTVVDKRTDDTDLKIIITEKASESEQCKIGRDFPTREQMIQNAIDVGLDPGPSSYAEGGLGLYTVNKFIITYKGKDITSKVNYKIEMPQVGRHTESGDSSKLAIITSPGIIDISTTGYFFGITCSYKNVKRTFQMKKVKAAPSSYILCMYCSKPWSNTEHDNRSMRELLQAGKCTCSQYWVIKFARALDIEIR